MSKPRAFASAGVSTVAYAHETSARNGWSAAISAGLGVNAGRGAPLFGRDADLRAEDRRRTAGPAGTAPAADAARSAGTAGRGRRARAAGRGRGKRSRGMFGPSAKYHAPGASPCGVTLIPVTAGSGVVPAAYAAAAAPSCASAAVASGCKSAVHSARLARERQRIACRGRRDEVQLPEAEAAARTAPAPGLAAGGAPRLARSDAPPRRPAHARVAGTGPRTGIDRVRNLDRARRQRVRPPRARSRRRPAAAAAHRSASRTARSRC